MKFPAVVVISSAAAFVAAGGYTVLPKAVTNTFDPACNIKGNVSINSGERIFHVPGQHYYEATRISLQHGERWFCSEDEARAAGWRKAGY